MARILTIVWHCQHSQKYEPLEIIVKKVDRYTIHNLSQYKYLQNISKLYALY